ncbi:MAG: hypothetical protein KJ023_08780 [Burkholderiaceae bacterium]|nr:hypothetical protein [Burkholderiaceae bacterium]
MPADGLARVRANVERLMGGDGFIGVWFPATSVCFTGVVLAGELVTWSMFPAPDQDSARQVAEAHRGLAESQIDMLRAAQAESARLFGRLTQ